MMLGRWRDQQDGEPIDVTGSLPDGTRFEGPQALKALLMDRKEQVMRHLTRKCSVMRFREASAQRIIALQKVF